MRATGVVLGEDSTLLREGLSRMIEGDGDLELAGVATDSLVLQL